MTIDGYIINTIYGATLLDYSFKSLLAYPKLKSPAKNDWAEHDGLEVDLSAPKLDKKQVILNFLCNENEVNAFIEFLKLKTYRNFIFNDLNKSFKLRITSVFDVKKIQGKCFLKIKLSDDFPLEGYTYVTPNLTASHDFGYLLDGVNFTKYGIIPLQGTKDSLEGGVEVKNKLEIKSKFLSGVKVAEQASKSKEYTATLNLFVKQNVINFFKGYNAFLYDLTKPNERTITAYGRNYKCFYNSSKIEDFIIAGDAVWCKFSVNVVVI